MSVTHVAGPVVIVAGKYDPDTDRIIQRCALCGKKLIDTEGQMAPVKQDGSPPDPPPVWGQKAFVRIDGNRQTRVGIYTKDEDPDDLCIDLVE